MSPTLTYLLDIVLPSAAEYEEAELELSAVVERCDAAARVDAEKKTKRRGGACAVAIDSLSDRAAREFGMSKTEVRACVSALCVLPNGGGDLRDGSLTRMEAIAVVHKHEVASNPALPIKTDQDVLVCGSGWGVDGYGVGKYGGIELLARLSDGSAYKVLGDVPAAINGWAQFLSARGVTMPGVQRTVCGLPISV